MVKTSLQIAVLATAAWAGTAHAVVVAQWDFEAAVAPVASTSWTGIAASTGSGSASGVHAGSATWTTPVGNGSTKSASANTWAIGDYWQFNFSTSGYTGLAISFDQTSSGTGPRDFTLAYSTNGISFTNFSNYSLLQNSTPAWTGATYAPAYNLSLSLSGVTALDNQTSVFVRLFNTSSVSASGGTVANGGASRIDNFTVNMTLIPEPGTYALLLAGLAVIGFVARRRVQA